MKKTHNLNLQLTFEESEASPTDFKKMAEAINKGIVRELDIQKIAKPQDLSVKIEKNNVVSEYLRGLDKKGVFLYCGWSNDNIPVYKVIFSMPNGSTSFSILAFEGYVFLYLEKNSPSYFAEINNCPNLGVFKYSEDSLESFIEAYKKAVEAAAGYVVSNTKAAVNSIAKDLYNLCFPTANS